MPPGEKTTVTIVTDTSTNFQTHTFTPIEELIKRLDGQGEFDGPVCHIDGVNHLDQPIVTRVHRKRIVGYTFFPYQHPMINEAQGPRRHH